MTNSLLAVEATELVDAAHPWGSCSAMTGRYGVQRHCLIIYPPGTSVADLLLARLWRGWPLGGAVLDFLAVMLLSDAWPPQAVIAGSAVSYAGVGVLLFRLGGPGRVQIRTMSVVVVPGIADDVERHRFVQWRTLTDMLTRADHLLSAGAITPAEHEATWWEAYGRLARR